MIYYYGKAIKKCVDQINPEGGSLENKTRYGQVVACEEQSCHTEQEDIWNTLAEEYVIRQPLEGQEAYQFLEGNLSMLDHVEEREFLIQNSFLLHGYYNYGYLLLSRQGESYYIAVPGNYYVREKAVAVIFDFQYFDCGITEAVPNGTFGYYFKRVILKEGE